MSADLQKRFKEMAKGERVYVGGKMATQNDLAALFTVRAAGLYLRSGGRIAFVLPLAALTRGQFERLRTGSFDTARVAWDAVWTMDERLQPLFPVPACVVFGRRRATSKPLPETVRAFWGTLPLRDAPETIADARLTVRDGAPALEVASFTGGSVYRKSFRQGATLVPRMLCFVERRHMGRLGADPSAPLVASRRSSNEKRPWKDLPGIENRVEAEFLHPVLLGESILPYRIWKSFEAVIPVSKKGEVLDSEAAANRGFDGLHDWMRKAEAVWNNDRPSEISLIQQFDYYGKLATQFPLAPLRVVYTASGKNAAACIIRERRDVNEHKLYWSKVASEYEGAYLCSILNSEITRSRAENWQSRGQWGARDFDKVMFNLPIPRFDPLSALHADLAEAARDAEGVAASVSIGDDVKFQRARKLVRDALADAGLAERIDALVARLLDGN